MILKEEPLAFQETTRSEEHTSELQSPCNLVCRLLLEKKKNRRRDRLLRQLRVETREDDYHTRTGVLELILKLADGVERIRRTDYRSRRKASDERVDVL